MSEMVVIHDSDCARHNEPAMPNGPCDCSIADAAAWAICPHLRAWRGENRECRRCPVSEIDPDYGRCTRMCRASADEVWRSVDAALSGETVEAQSEGEAKP